MQFFWFVNEEKSLKKKLRYFCESSRNVRLHPSLHQVLVALALIIVLAEAKNQLDVVINEVVNLPVLFIDLGNWWPSVELFPAPLRFLGVVEVKSAPCVFDSMWAFSQSFSSSSLVIVSPTPTSPVSLFVPHYTSLFYSTIPLYPAHSIAAVLCARHRAAWHSLRASVDPGCHPYLLLSSFPSPLPSYPCNRETCAWLFMLFLWHFH